MHSVITSWILFVTFMVLVTISGGIVTYSRGPNERKSGETMVFEWTSNKTILEATWGIRSGNNFADPQYIFVRFTNNVPVVNPTLPPDIKNRIHYTGDLTAGLARFILTDVTFNDSNTYIGIIREEGSSPQPYYIDLTVVAPTTTSVPTTSPSTGSPTSTSGNQTTTTSITTPSTTPTATLE